MIPPGGKKKKKRRRKEKSHFCHWQVLKQIFQLLNSPLPGEVTDIGQVLMLVII